MLDSIYNLQMRQLLYSRREGQSKKQLYRRMALLRKAQWATTHKLQSQSQFKSHFITEEDDTLSDDSKTKKIQKEAKSQQRLRNRMAAQQSRERHRCYVEELQRKAGLYDQLMSKKQHLLCKKCQYPIQVQAEDSQALISSDYPRSMSPNKPKQQIILHEYMDEQMIRIDNEGATSPYGIFFIICMVAVIAVFSFRGDTGDISPRLLANYRSTVSELIDMETKNSIQKPRGGSLPAFLQMVTAKNKQGSTSCPHEEVDTNSFKSSHNLRRLAAPLHENKWQKFGDYVCSEPEEEFKLSENQFTQNPEFFLVRAKKNKKSILQFQSPSSPSLDVQHQDQRLSAKQWQEILVSSCFLESA